MTTLLVNIFYGVLIGCLWMLELETLAVASMATLLACLTLHDD